MDEPGPASDFEALTAVGLGSDDVLAYQQVLSHPGITAVEVAGTSGLRESRVRAALDTLAEHGLVTQKPARPARYRASAPQVALEALVQRRLGAISQVRVLAESLQDRYIRSETPESAQPIELLTGSEALAARYVQMQQMATRETLTLDRPPYFQATSANLENVESAIDRGVTCRAIYDQDALDHPGKLTAIRADIRNGERARYLSELPLKLVVVDDQAIVPLRAHADDRRALVLDGPALVAGLRRLFELLWDRATPLDGLGRPHDDDRRDGHDLELLALLEAGLTDKSIARHLDISRRTLTRRVGRLMDELEASSRFQAGVRASRAGWLDLPSDPDAPSPPPTGR